MKMLGFAALAAMAAMAFLGASSASAKYSSVLCLEKEHVCSEKNSVELKVIHLTQSAGSIGTLHGLTPLFNVLCLNVLALGETLHLGELDELAEPPVREQYEIHLTKLDFTNCGTNATHNNCEIKSLVLPILLSLLTEELENGSGNGWGTLTKLNGETLVKCNLPLIGTIDCIYEGKGTTFKAENTGARGMVTANGVALKKTAGSGFCSAESTITQGLLEPLPSSEDPEHVSPAWVSS